MKARLINENDKIEEGTVLYDKIPLLGIQKVTVTRVTKTLIICGEARYNKDGSVKGDQYGRCRLYIAI